MSFVHHSCYFSITVLILSIYATNVNEAKYNSRLIMESNWPQELNKGIKRFPHHVSCYHFFLTRPDGRHTLKKCPDGKRFDFPSLKCSDQKSAKCWSEQIKRKYSKKAAKDVVCPFSWGFYPDIDDCSKFFSCVGGTPYHRKCHPSTLFDKALRQCVKESEAMCADSLDIVEPGFECPYKWGLFAHSKDCSKFHVCLQKKASARSCKKNMLFDNMGRECLPKEKVDCGQKYNPYALENISTTIALDSSTMSFTTADMQSSAQTKKRNRHPVTTDSPEAKNVTTKQSAIINNIGVKILELLMSTKETTLNTPTDDIPKSSKENDGTNNVDKQFYYPQVTARSSTKYILNMKPEESPDIYPTNEEEGEEAKQPIPVDDLSDSKNFQFTGEHIQNTSDSRIEPIKKYLNKLAHRASIYSTNDTKSEGSSESVPINHLSSGLAEDFQFTGEHMPDTSNEFIDFTTEGFDKSYHLNASKRKSFVYVPKVECYPVSENQERNQLLKEAADLLPNITPYLETKGEEGSVIHRTAKEADIYHQYQTFNGEKPTTYAPVRSFKLPFRKQFQSSLNEVPNQPRNEIVHLSPDSIAEEERITSDSYIYITENDVHKLSDYSTLDSKRSTAYTPKLTSDKQFGKKVRCRVVFAKKILNLETNDVDNSSSGLWSSGEGNTAVPFIVTTKKNVSKPYHYSAVTKEPSIPHVLKQKSDKSFDNDFQQSTVLEKEEMSNFPARGITDLFSDLATNVMLEHEQATSDSVGDRITKKK